MATDVWGQLRQNATLAMQRRFVEILHRIAKEGKVDPETAQEVEAMGKIWSTLHLDWVRDDKEGIW